jgi:hypothetical protein
MDGFGIMKCLKLLSEINVLYVKVHLSRLYDDFIFQVSHYGWYFYDPNL